MCIRDRLCVADQPYLRLHTFKKLLELADGEHIICVTCQGILRNPAVFPRKYYKELLALSDEQGGKQILKKYREKVIAVPCDVDEVRDIDKRSEDVYKRQVRNAGNLMCKHCEIRLCNRYDKADDKGDAYHKTCLLYTSNDSERRDISCQKI